MLVIRNTTRGLRLLLLGGLLIAVPAQGQQDSDSGEMSLFDLQSLSTDPAAAGNEALATGIVNGDFATGDFTGWTVSAIDDSEAPINPDPFISVTTLGDNNVAQFETGEFADGLFIATLEQTFVVPADEPLLSFDFTLPNVEVDPTGTGTSSFFDSFSVSLEDVANFSFFDLLLVDQFGALPDPFGTAPGEVTLGVPADPVFDFTFTADLSSLVDETVTLFFDLNSEDDGFQFENFAVDNVANLAVPPDRIPEPNTLWLLGIGLIGLLVTSKPWKRVLSWISYNRDNPEPSLG